MAHLELLHSFAKLEASRAWQGLASLLLERDYFG